MFSKKSGRNYNLEANSAYELNILICNLKNESVKPVKFIDKHKIGNRFYAKVSFEEYI